MFGREQGARSVGGAIANDDDPRRTVWGRLIAASWRECRFLPAVPTLAPNWLYLVLFLAASLIQFLGAPVRVCSVCDCLSACL